MTTALEALLEGRLPAAVYRWPVATRAEQAAAAAAAAAAGWRPFLLEGEGIRDRETFLDACFGTFELPDWFGRNWDALWDCLTDLSWFPAPGYLVTYDQWAELAIADPDAWAAGRDLLVDVSRYWHARHIPFAVLLRGEGPDMNLPTLTATGRA